MAQILCNKSGILFNCEFLPLTLHSRELSHPLFSVPQKKLLSLTGEWARGRLKLEESYLLYLSLLNSTDLIEWRDHATFTEKTPGILAANMESLIQCIGKINLINHPSFKLPKFIIHRDTASLTGSHHWIEIWLDNCNDWVSSQRDQRKREEIKARLEMRENALDRVIRSAYASDPKKTSALIAEWASIVAQFPSSTTPHPITKRPVPLAEYWKDIIRAAHDEDKLWRFPRTDIIELLEHCEEYIQNEGIRGHALFSLLRNGLKLYDTYAGLSNFEITRNPSSPTFTVISGEEETYVAAVQTMIDAAPSHEPKRESYASHFAWLKDHMKWKIASLNHNKSGAK